MNNLEHRRKLSKQYVSHLMELSCYISETLKHQGKTWEDLDKLLGRDDCKVWIGGAASNLTLRDLSTIEVELGVNLVRNYTDKELGLVGKVRF